MLLSEVSIRRPIFTAMICLCILVLGLKGLRELGTDLYPDVSFPVVLITTVYPGSGPSEMEFQVVKPIEDAIAGINGMKSMHSYARENVSLIAVEFSLDIDLADAVQEVRDKVANISGNLPQDAEPPVISRLDLGATPILTYAASADLDAQQLRKLLEDRLKPALSQIPGVAEVRITGGNIREIQVELDLLQARALGVSPLEVARKLGHENVTLPAGRLKLGTTEMIIRTVGEFQDLESIRALPIAQTATGSQIRLGDVARVIDGKQEQRTLAQLNSQSAVIIEVIKQPGSNTVQVTDAVKERLAGLSPTLATNFKATLLIDQSLLIRENAKEVWIALFFGGAMAILIILIFLLDPRGTFISSLALPASVIGTFFVMYALDYTLNQMTLLALSLAIGLLIDDAVVVREAITHRLERGESPMSAALEGTKDVGLAVLATTLTLVAVFVPVAFMPGISGQFFKQFGLTISAAVLISLFISFTLDPMLSARMAKARVPGQQRQRSAVARTILSGLEASERFYERVLRWVLGHKIATMLLSLLVFGISLFAASSLEAEFLPAEDRGQFIVDLKLPDAANIDESSLRVTEAEKLLKGIPEVRDTYCIIGLNGEVNKARIRVLTTPKSERTRTIGEMKEDARKRLAVLPATDVSMSEPPTFEGVGDYFPIMLRVVGPEFDELQRHINQIAQYLREIPGTEDVKIDFSPSKPELQVLVDRTRANDVGVSAGDVAMQLRLAVEGQTVGKLREGSEETDIVVRLSEQDRNSPERLQLMNIFTPHGPRELTDLSKLAVRNGPAVIEHEDRQRQIAVYAQIAPGAALGKVAEELDRKLAKTPLPAGYSIVYDGQIKSFHEQNDAFGDAFGLAFIFIFMVLAAQFESLKHPFTIMVSLPLALIGALLALVITGYHLSLGAMIGIILLMGLVTKNAILLVDGALQNLRAGDDVDTALLKAGPRRLRPILMTSAAMAVGMLPTALGTGLGAEFRAPMAVSVIGGVISSTLLTLLIVPVIFAGLERLRPTKRAPITQSQEEPRPLAASSNEERAA